MMAYAKEIYLISATPSEDLTHCHVRLFIDHKMLCENSQMQPVVYTKMAIICGQTKESTEPPVAVVSHVIAPISSAHAL
jgi:hypothetical protein